MRYDNNFISNIISKSGTVIFYLPISKSKILVIFLKNMIKHDQYNLIDKQMSIVFNSSYEINHV